MVTLMGAAIILTCILDVSSGAQFLLTVPKEVYYDSNILVSVTAFEVLPKEKEVVMLEFRGLKDRSRVLNATTLEFTTDSSKVWTVVFPWERIQQIDEDGVELRMISGGHEVSKELTFTQNFGYIFIQTDKPIYTPLQTVKFRVIAVDEYQKLTKYLIRIDIKNHKQIVVDRMRYTAEEAFKAKEFELPKDTPAGMWSITANFEGMGNSSGAIHTVTFEVREYVLPRFSSSVRVDPDVITKGTKWITINVTSWYVYGRPLLGSVDLKLGIWNSNHITMLQFNSTEEPPATQLINGQLVKDIYVGQMFGGQNTFSMDNRLYVKATVTETASLESDTIEDTSTFITHPYYLIDFKRSKNYFKPGFPYTLQARVHTKSGRTVSWVNLYIIPFFSNGSDDQMTAGPGKLYLVNSDGELKQDFDVPPGTSKINFTAIVADPGAPDIERFTFGVNKYTSLNDQYIHITLAAPIKRNSNGDVLLRYTKPFQPRPPSNYKPEIITVLILAKGHIVYTATSFRNLNGTSNVPLPSYLYKEISPSMRIVAYYLVPSALQEFVVDSLLVDTPDVCLEEIYLTPPGGLNGVSGLYKPKDTFELNVEGAPDTHVGFVAVDKAVSYLTNKPTLNRNLLFSQLGSHDMGLEGGDGNSLSEVLENSGLHHLHISTDTATSELGPGWDTHVGASIYVGSNGGMIAKSANPGINRPSLASAGTPPQSVRNYFPESWFFEEKRLPRSGHLGLKLALPDTVTTWSFLAVGISPSRGVCVSQPLEQRVMKLFFADVRLPYKATRLEEIKVKISVYNYQIYTIDVTVTVSGQDGLCFSANSVRGNTQNSTTFQLSIAAGQSKGMAIKMIPLKIGDLTLRVDLQNQRERDVVEKKLHVVAEGQRVKKSITFVLDPEAKHATFMPSKKNKTSLYESTMINNTFDLKNHQQQTRIDLALPSNVIKGTESCRISAFGDLMGDIITHAVVESKNLISASQLNAEEILGDLAPTVHALHSAQTFGLMDKNLKKKSTDFVKRSVGRLTKYRHDSFGFSLTSTPKAKPSTWLTAFVLKTLCHANSLVFLDREKLIDNGFQWLMKQVKNDGTMNEHEQRLTNMSPSEYSVLLSAEALITTLECKQFDQNPRLPLQEKSYSLHESSQKQYYPLPQGLQTHEQTQLQTSLSSFLETNLRLIKDPMILAKVTYALILFDPTSKESQEAVKRLSVSKRRNRQGQYYWSNIQENEEPKETPYWFHKAPHANAVEATAYALMVFLSHGGTNVDAIADWLVGQRNYNGAFIGAVDSAAAIQALSHYSLQKQGSTVNLHCNVSSDRQKDLYSFRFTEENAIFRESLHNVPVGRVLDFLTHGQGLGQMQVNIEYNIPIDKNRKCPFQVIAKVSQTTFIWSPDMTSNPMCSYCNIGCQKPQAQADPVPGNMTANTTAKPAARMVLKVNTKVNKKKKTQGSVGKKKKPAKPARKPKKTTSTSTKPSTQKKKVNKKTKQPDQASKRPKRQLADNSAASRRSICVHVCLQHVQPGLSEPTEVRIEMLTGYQPVHSDLQKIKEMPDVQNIEYDSLLEVVRVQFSKISCTEKACVAFRAIQEEEAERLMPANVEVIQIGTAAPQCVIEYHGLPNDQSLQVYCADFAHKNKGECRCYSGLCSLCKPATNGDLSLYDVTQLACKSPIAYQLQIAKVTTMDRWLEIDSKVISLNKTGSGSDNISSGSVIKMMTPTGCFCPASRYTSPSEKFYMLSADVEKMVDRNGNYVYRYLLDEQSTILTVADQFEQSPPYPSVPYVFLRNALSSSDQCEEEMY